MSNYPLAPGLIENHVFLVETISEAGEAYELLLADANSRQRAIIRKSRCYQIPFFGQSVVVSGFWSATSLPIYIDRLEVLSNFPFEEEEDSKTIPFPKQRSNNLQKDSKYPNYKQPITNEQSMTKSTKASRDSLSGLTQEQLSEIHSLSTDLSANEVETGLILGSYEHKADSTILLGFGDDGQQKIWKVQQLCCTWPLKVGCFYRCVGIQEGDSPSVQWSCRWSFLQLFPISHSHPFVKFSPESAMTLFDGWMSEPANRQISLVGILLEKSQSSFKLCDFSCGLFIEWQTPTPIEEQLGSVIAIHNVSLRDLRNSHEPRLLTPYYLTDETHSEEEGDSPFRANLRTLQCISRAGNGSYQQISYVNVHQLPPMTMTFEQFNNRSLRVPDSHQLQAFLGKVKAQVQFYEWWECLRCRKRAQKFKSCCLQHMVRERIFTASFKDGVGNGKIGPIEIDLNIAATLFGLQPYDLKELGQIRSSFLNQIGEKLFYLTLKVARRLSQLKCSVVTVEPVQ